MAKQTLSQSLAHMITEWVGGAEKNGAERTSVRAHVVGLKSRSHTISLRPPPR